MRIVLLTGGDGAALAHGVATLLTPDETLEVVVPVTRDLWANGLKCCPDVDAVLAASLPSSRPDDCSETFGVADELAAIGFSPAWVRPSDADLARQLVRTELLHAGYSLTDATTAMATRVSAPFRLLPVSDERAEQHVVVEEPDIRRAVHVEEFLADPHGLRPTGVTIVAETWTISPNVRAALDAADAVVLGPSSPALALGPLLSAPGLRDQLGDHLTTPLLRVVRLEPERPGADVLAALAPVDLPPATAVPDDAGAVLSAARAGARR